MTYIYSSSRRKIILFAFSHFALCTQNSESSVENCSYCVKLTGWHKTAPNFSLHSVKVFTLHLTTVCGCLHSHRTFKRKRLPCPRYSFRFAINANARSLPQPFGFLRMISLTHRFPPPFPLQSHHTMMFIALYIYTPTPPFYTPSPFLLCASIKEMRGRVSASLHTRVFCARGYANRSSLLKEQKKNGKKHQNSLPFHPE